MIDKVWCVFMPYSSGFTWVKAYTIIIRHCVSTSGRSVLNDH